MHTLLFFNRLLGIFASLVVLSPLVQAQFLVTVPGLPECAETCADRAAFVAACLPITQKCLCEATNSISSSTIRCAQRSCNAANFAIAQAAVANFCAVVTTPSPSASSSSPVVTQDTTVFTTVTSSLTSTSTSDSTTLLPSTTLSIPTTSSTPPTLPVATSASADSTTVVIETIIATPTNAAVSLHPRLSHGHGNGGMMLTAGFLGLVLGMAVL